ncbi:MAG: hypothetical protein J7L38_07785, partial [Thermoproteales archaeon]|nr:hypothetical protein [Thermoproteales archaeon]
MFSLPQELERALLEVSDILSRTDIRWLLVGSTASYLNGLDVIPKDLDIIVEANRVYEVDRLFAANFLAVKRVKYSSSEIYSSHYGIFKVHGVKVKVMADLIICREDGCLKTVFEYLYSCSKRVKIKNATIRLVPLEWQLVANVMIPGKEKRVKDILVLLKTRG